MERIGRYLIERELGRGAMGVVFLATDPAIGRPVVIKTIRLSEFAEPQDRRRLRERLLQEARLAGALSHPNIVTVYDAGEQEELTYIAMEYVSGPTLEQLLDRRQALEPAVLFRILREAASALDYAHAKGIVHRDVKPANILIQDSGAVKITDFGIAKIQASPLATQAGLVLGTPSYMSPEQALGRPVDGRSDQFSLAVIAFEMLTGEKPFLAEEIPALLYKIAHDPPPAVHALNPSLGWAADLVLKRAMEKGPAARYPSCAEFVAALESACRSSKDWKPLPRGSSQSLPTVAAAPAAAGPSVERPASRRLRDTEQRRKDLVVTLFSALITIGLISLAVIWFLGRDRQTVPPTGPDAAVEKALPGERPSPAGPRVAAPEQGPSPEEPPAAPATKPIQPPAPAAGEPDATASVVAAQPAATTPAPAPKPAVSAPKPKAPAPGPAEETVVTFTTTPTGATVIVSNGDGARKCVAPCALTLLPGRYSAAATLTGYRTALRMFTIPDEPDVALSLERMSGKVRVSSDPPGAAIFVNGQRQRAVTPATLELPTGKHTIEVTAEGYARSRQEIEVKDNAFLSLTFTLGR